MVKKLLTLFLGLTLAFNASAQLVTIDPNDVQFWTGTGSNSTVVAIGWDDDSAPHTPTVVIWGVRWEGTIYLINALDTIAAYDSRFSYTMNYSYLQTLTFNDSVNGLVLTPFMEWNCNSYNGLYGSTLLTITPLLITEASCDDYTFTGITNIVYATDPNAVSPTTEDATIDLSEILFWVGSGANEAVMAVNWADTALAWGYRWNGTATVADMMADIAAADPRFSYVGEGLISDINYIDTAAGMTTPLGITPGSYWGSTNNGVMDMGMAQTLSNGDFEKWADSSTGILVDSVWVDEWGGYWNYIYVYPMTIHPVTVPDTVHDGINDHELSRVYAYPNPCSGTLYIINEHADRIELYNMNGKLLEAIENRDTQVILNMQQYPTGMYLLKVGNGVQKILKK